MIDADTRRVQTRLGQLAEALKEAGIQALRDEEQVARLIPRRNVETWLLCLNGRFVDEETDYKNEMDDWTDLMAPASVALFEWARPNAVVPDHCTDSLQRGLKELNRLSL